MSNRLIRTRRHSHARESRRLSSKAFQSGRAVSSLRREPGERERRRGSDRASSSRTVRRVSPGVSRCVLLLVILCWFLVLGCESSDVCVQLWSVSTLQSPVTRLTSAEERLGSRVASRYAGLAEKRAGEADTTVTK